jgi:PAS domain S-box-containing protein
MLKLSSTITPGVRAQNDARSGDVLVGPIGPRFANYSALFRYAVAVLVVGVVAGLRIAAVPWMGTQAPLLPFVFAVLAAAYLSGFGPALLASLIASIVSALMVDEVSTAWGVHLALFALLSCLASVMMHRLQLAHGAQRAALASAQANEQQLRVIADAMPVLISYVDRDHRYRFNNRHYELWFGERSDDLRGRHAREVLGEAAYQALMPKFQAALSGKHVNFETEIPYRGGKRHVNAHYVPDLGEDGVARGFFALVEDVSERKRAEQALESARLELSLALRAGRSGTFEWDIVANSNNWSDELHEVYGFKPGEFDGSQEAWLECVDPEDVDRIRAISEQALKEGDAVFEFRIRRHDTGELRWLQGSGKVFYDAGRRPIRMRGINVDITEQKRAEEALVAADRHKDDFLAMLAHELRNPLTPIRNVAYVLSDSRTDVETAHRCGELIQRQVGHLARLVDDLLDAARIRRGAVEIRKEALDVEVIVDRALETLRPTFAAKQQVVNFVRSPFAVRVDGDVVRLEQVFVNLLSNASKYSPLKATIHVAVDLTNDVVTVSVRDEGAGIDAQMLPRIFDLFMQADRSLDRSHGGLGIGLTIVKRIVELHGGTVEAHSVGLGQGSEFRVHLPRLVQEVASPEHGVLGGESERPHRRVLIVEDNVDAAESLMILLAADGHQVHATRNGKEALRELESFAPEWIFMDIGLPEMDGYALAELMRQSEHGKEARIYAVTGYGRPEDRELSLKAGFDGHMTKPVDPQALLTLLADSRESHQASPH